MLEIMLEIIDCSAKKKERKTMGHPVLMTKMPLTVKLQVGQV